jgi:hypothetical protein
MRPIDPPEGWIRCRICGRYREKGRPCRRCNEPAPPPCGCEGSPGWSDTHADGRHVISAWTHRHLLHALLEVRYQLGVESADPWLEHLLAEAWWERDEGDRPPRSDWRVEPTMALHLEAFPALGPFLASPDPVQAVFDWAGVPVHEADVYMAAANGYTMAAIAHHYGIQPVTAEARFANAQARIQLALEFSPRGEAI